MMVNTPSMTKGKKLLKTMKRFLTIMALVLTVAFAATAQVQQGYVKTRGRLGKNGNVIAGTRLSGAAVQVKGRNAVLSNANGVFSMPLPSSKYYLESVKKNGFFLIDPEILFKQYTYSTNPFVIVMDTPEQQKTDKLQAEKSLRRQLEKKLQEKEDALEDALDQNKMTQELYEEALEALFREKDKNGLLISEMAEHFSMVDYDQLDEFNRQVNACIINGDLVKADSLLRSKGDIDSRIAKVHEQQAAQAAEKAEIERRQDNLEQSIAGTQATIADIALDCHNYFKKFIMENQHDSAALYIEKRANLDPNNSQWQFDAGSYFQKRGILHKAEEYYQRALMLARQQAQTDPQTGEPILAMTLNNVAPLYQEQGRRNDAERMLNEALDIYRRLATGNPEVFKLYVASTLNNLANLSTSFSQSEALYSEAIDIYWEYAQDDARAYIPYAASVMNNLGLLYDENEYGGESEEMYQNALGIYRRLAENSPEIYMPDVAATLNNLSALYHRYNAKAELGEQMQLESQQIYRELVKEDPKLYYPKLAVSLSNLAVQYYGDERDADGEKAYDEALEAYRWLAQDNSVVYKPQLASKLYDQAIRLYQADKLDKSEKLFNEALGLYRELAAFAPNTYEPEVAKMLRNIATLLDKRQKWNESEKMYQEELAINKKLAQQQSQYTVDVARTLGNLSNHALLMKQFDKAAEYARQGLAYDNTRLFIQANLAAAHLFMGEYDQAEAIYLKYRSELRDTFLEDLEQFGQLGIIPQQRVDDVNRIKQLLQQ